MSPPFGQNLAAALPSRLLMTDPARTPDVMDWMERLPPEAGIIFRHYGAPGRAALAEKLAVRAIERGRPFLVAGDVDLALRCGATGLHLPEWMLRRPPPRNLLTRFEIVTAAAHSLGAALRAAALGCDAALLGPVFATASHPDARALGLERASAIAQRVPIALYALGGMTELRWRMLAASEFIGFAGIGAFAAPA